MSEQSDDQDLQRIKRAIDLLGEHFHTVHIFASRHEPGKEDETVHISLGTGNWFARYGQIRTWIIREDERSRESVRSRNNE